MNTLFFKSKKITLWVRHLVLAMMILIYSTRSFSLSADLLTPSKSPASQKIELPFSYENGLIIVPAVLGGKLSLRFVFDTGAEHTTITSQEVLAIFPFEYLRPIKMIGVDLHTIYNAHLVKGVELSLGTLALFDRQLLVTEEDLLAKNQQFGPPIHGILGADILSQYVVEINYLRKMVILYSPEHFKPNKKYQSIELEVYRKKPYITLPTQMTQNSTAQPFKYLLDSGAALKILLIEGRHPDLILPDSVVTSVLGLGLGGTIEGMRGEIHRIQIGSLVMPNLIGGFQDLTYYSDTSLLNERHGLVGNYFLEHFDVVIDYSRNLCYFRPNRQFKEGEQPDLSGLFILMGGHEGTEALIQSVWPGSPADTAGLLSGDKLKKINGWPVSILGIKGIQKRLRKAPGKRVRLKIKRDGTTYKKQFSLGAY
jgi:hypothetical protein